MARDRANILTGIWGNPDVRALPPLQQWLYLQLWTHPNLSYVGVIEWRPGKLAQLSAGSTAGSIRDLVPLLVERHFLVIDEDSEEVLLRPYLRHDGLLKQPKLSVSMANAYASTGSTRLRGAIVHELLRLREEHPDWAAWAASQVQTILKHPALDPKANASALPMGLPLPLPMGLPQSAGSPLPLPTSTATATATPSNEGKSAAKRGTRIPDDFEIDDIARQWAKSNAPAADIDVELEKFVDYWTALAGAKAVKVDWPATWRNWMRNAQKFAVDRGWTPAREVPQGQEWMNR